MGVNMARLFISYKRAEQDYAFALRQWLMDRQGWASDDIFVDLDHLRAGGDWATKLFTEAESAQAMLFLASDASLHQDSFCYRELRRARGQVLAMTLGEVAVDDERLRRVLPYEALARQIAALDQQPTEGFEFVSPVDGSHGVVGLNRGQVESIGSVLRDLGIAPNSFIWTARDDGPYPGLAPLQEGDEAIFCGRDIEIRDSLRSLEEMRERVSSKVLLIQAPSGAGKSSFLRAGLWARLRNHAAFTPLGIVRASQGILTHPEWGLISQLHEPRSNLLDLARDEIQDRVSDNLPSLLAELADSDKDALGHRRTVLLGIDQAEEIELLVDNERHEFEHLINAILSCEPALDIRLIMTVRDDNLDGMLAHLEHLGLRHDAISTERLHRLSAYRYRDIIRGPAEAAIRADWPLTIESDLELALAEAAGADRSDVGDALPLLAITLQRLVRHRRRGNGDITLTPEQVPAFFEAAIADTVKDALSKVGSGADDNDLAQLIVPRLAIWDPNVGEAGAAKRVVATSETLFAGERARLRPLADALVDQRLLTRTKDLDKPYYEVAHEALLRVPPMGNILYGLREQYILAHILRVEADAWWKNAQQEDHLARAGDRLTAARQLLANDAFGPELKKSDTHIHEYLDACAEKAELDEKHKEKQRQEELILANARAEAAMAQQEASNREAVAAQQVARRTRVALVVTTVLMLTASAFGWLVYQGTIKAEEAADEADRQKVTAQAATEEAKRQEDTAQITESRLLATFAQQAIQKQDFGNAVGLALLGLPQNLDDPESRPLTIEPQQALLDSLHNLKEQKRLGDHEGPVNGALELQDQRLLTWSKDRTARLWQADGTAGPVLRGHESRSMARWSCRTSACSPGVMTAPSGFGRPMARRDRFCAVTRVQSMARWSCRTSACSPGVSDRTARLWQADGTAGPVLRGHEGRQWRAGAAGPAPAHLEC